MVELVLQNLNELPYARLTLLLLLIRLLSIPAELELGPNLKAKKLISVLLLWFSERVFPSLISNRRLPEKTKSKKSKGRQRKKRRAKVR